MSTSSPPSLSSLFIRLPGTEGKIAANCSSRIFLCSTGSRPRRKSSSSPPSPARLIAHPKKLPAADAPPLQPKKRHWSVGEFPGKSDISILRSQRPPIKNVKKKVDRRAAAKAWVCTVTEALADKIQKKQWEQALEQPVSQENQNQLINSLSARSLQNPYIYPYCNRSQLKGGHTNRIFGGPLNNNPTQTHTAAIPTIVRNIGR